MKSFTNFTRKIHPFMLLPFMFVATLLVFKFAVTATPEIMVTILMSQLFLMLAVLQVLKKVTQGDYTQKDGQKYVSQVTVCYFGERVRWTGYFKYKFTAVFSAQYQAWYLDHFGEVHPDCGINYHVNSINESTPT